MLGLVSENGPIHLEPGTQNFTQNKYAWNNLLDYIWVDQPV
jgi:carboxypeptidase D